jgi:hypothetical protein
VAPQSNDVTPIQPPPTFDGPAEQGSDYFISDESEDSSPVLLPPTGE